MLQTFHEMWAELLEELVYGILDQPAIDSDLSFNLVVCEDIPAGCDPQKTLVSRPSKYFYNQFCKLCRIVLHSKIEKKKSLCMIEQG